MRKKEYKYSNHYSVSNFRKGTSNAGKNTNYFCFSASLTCRNSSRFSPLEDSPLTRLFSK
jgi:hypothetical protein